MISAELRHRGLSPALSPAQADVIVANTCSVTAQADRTARAFLRRVRRENPTARILVTGCYAQRAPHELAALPGVHAVVGNSHKSLVAEIAQQAAAAFVPLAALRPAPALYVDHTFAHSELSMLEHGRNQGRNQAGGRAARLVPILRCRMVVATAAPSASFLRHAVIAAPCRSKLACAMCSPLPQAVVPSWCFPASTWGVGVETSRRNARWKNW